VEATNAQGLTTGRYVHYKTGLIVDNPVQMVTKAATGLDPTDTYIGQDKDGDGSADGLGSALGTAVIGIAGAATLHSTYKTVDGITGGKLSKAQEKIRHKMKGDIPVTDNDGNTKWYSKEAIESVDDLLDEEDGKKVFRGGSYKDLNDIIDQRSTSAGAFQTPQANVKTSPITPPTKNAVNPDIDNSSQGENTSKYVPKYSTNDEISQAKQRLQSSSNDALGREELKSKVATQKETFLADIQDGIASGDEGKVTKASKNLALANKISKAIDEGLDIDTSELKKINVDIPHVTLEKTQSGHIRKKVDFDSLGENVRAIEEAHIRTAEEQMKPSRAQSQPSDKKAGHV